MRLSQAVFALLAVATSVSARAAFSDGRSMDLWARQGCPARCANFCPDVSFDLRLFTRTFAALLMFVNAVRISTALICAARH